MPLENSAQTHTAAITTFQLSTPMACTIARLTIVSVTILPGLDLIDNNGFDGNGTPSHIQNPKTPNVCNIRRSHFHIQNLQGKVTGYDYYTTLEKLTNNAGMGQIKV